MEQSEKLMMKIKEAFQYAEFPSHLGLHAALAKDKWVQNPIKLKQITLEKDYFGDWWDVPDKHLEECGSLALNYLDAVGVYFYLPAFMLKALRDKTVKSLSPVSVFLNPIPFNNDQELYLHFCEKFKLFDSRNKHLCTEFLRIMNKIMNKIYIEHTELCSNRNKELIEILEDDFWAGR